MLDLCYATVLLRVRYRSVDMDHVVRERGVRRPPGEGSVHNRAEVDVGISMAMGAAQTVAVLVVEGHVAILRVAFGNLDDLGNLLVLVDIVVGAGVITDWGSAITTLNGDGEIAGEAIELDLQRDAIGAIARVVGLGVRLEDEAKVLGSGEDPVLRICRLTVISVD